jgi:hypothetical protein
VIENSRR